MMESDSIWEFPRIQAPNANQKMISHMKTPRWDPQSIASLLQPTRNQKFELFDKDPKKEDRKLKVFPLA